jgi:flagellar basal-body rod modification protein FlgD
VKDWVGRADASTSTKKVDPDKAPVAGGDLDKDTFLRLLVAQLKYQDPDKPADGTQFVSETAQFTTVEKLTDLASVQQSLLTAQLRLGAAQMVGKEISYLGADGKPATGVVRAATVNGATPSVKVADTDVPLSSVQEVRNPEPATL